jgi:hypothetical protein
MAKPKRPRDTNQLAKLIVDISTGEIEQPKDPNLPKRGRAGGLKGGIARAAALTPAQRKKIAMKAARKRWKAETVD